MLQLRIGIDVGPVVAGVVGRSRFIYELVGRSVGWMVGGRRRIRTSVGFAGDFTGRSLWPLGHPPGITAEDSNGPSRS
jgi:adenylate/guanylate cyclase family protein